VPIRPTVKVTVQGPVAVPQENTAFAEVGVLIDAPAQLVDHWMVSVPPLPVLESEARAAVWGGRTSDGLIENELMPGQPNADWPWVTAPASMASEPVWTSAVVAASVATTHVMFETTLVMAPALIEKDATVPEQKSPALSWPVSVQV
jgi:hypothetical protein